MLINMEKHVRGEISSLVIRKLQKQSGLAPCKHNTDSDMLRARFWGDSPASEGL